VEQQAGWSPAGLIATEGFRSSYIGDLSPGKIVPLHGA